MVQSLELDMDASCSSLTHARTLQLKFTPFVAGWLERHSDQFAPFQNVGPPEPTSLALPAAFH